jgi:hypothetical protein
MWELLNLESIIEEASATDRSGSAVLEYLLRLPNILFYQDLATFYRKKIWLFLVCIYGGFVGEEHIMNSLPPMNHCMMSVLAITADAAKELSKPNEQKRHWSTGLDPCQGMLR